MNRIYLSRPMEILAKIVSWILVITIDLFEFILAPFMHIGAKCIAALTLVAAGCTGYVYFALSMPFAKAAALFGGALAAILIVLCVLRIVKHVLVKVIRPPFADVVFESVAVSIRRPRRNVKIKV